MTRTNLIRWSGLALMLGGIAFGVQQETDDPNDLMMFASLLARLLDDL